MSIFFTIFTQQLTRTLTNINLNNNMVMNIIHKPFGFRIFEKLVGNENVVDLCYIF